MTDPVPRLLREWTDLIGPDPAWTLVKRWGGTRLYVPTPEHLHPGHALARAIGLEAARRLAEHYQGETLLVPLASRTLEALKEAAILDDLAAGLSVRQIVLKHRVHERRVYRIKERARLRLLQPDLFEEWGG